MERKIAVALVFLIVALYYAGILMEALGIEPENKAEEENQVVIVENSSKQPVESVK